MNENRWCEKRWIVGISEVGRRNVGSNGFDAVFELCCVCVLCSDFFEEKTNVLSSARDTGPVDKLVGRVFGALLAFGSWFGGGHGMYLGCERTLLGMNANREFKYWFRFQS